RATAGLAESAPCLVTDWVLSQFAESKNIAQNRFNHFVQQGAGTKAIWADLKNQIYLGNEQFVAEMQSKLRPQQSLKDIPKKQKQEAIKPLDFFANLGKTRDECMALAYLSGHYTLEQVGKYFGVSYATVSRAVKRFEGRLGEN
ncbi:MAG: addiction module toxin RelE, partial [Burkholderiales bacterium]|nr:addiction module toxin RelE [Burkholderiales bacterium]